MNETKQTDDPYNFNEKWINSIAVAMIQTWPNRICRRTACNSQQWHFQFFRKKKSKSNAMRAQHMRELTLNWTWSSTRSDQAWKENKKGNNKINRNMHTAHHGPWHLLWYIKLWIDFSYHAVHQTNRHSNWNELLEQCFSFFWFFCCWFHYSAFRVRARQRKKNTFFSAYK